MKKFLLLTFFLLCGCVTTTGEKTSASCYDLTPGVSKKDFRTCFYMGAKQDIFYTSKNIYYDKTSKTEIVWPLIEDYYYVFKDVTVPVYCIPLSMTGCKLGVGYFDKHFTSLAAAKNYVKKTYYGKSSESFPEDLLTILLDVHIIDISEDNYKTMTTENHVRKDLEIANQIWNKFGINWYINKISFIKPNLSTFVIDRGYLKKFCNSNGACVSYHKKKLSTKKDEREYLSSPVYRHKQTYNKFLKTKKMSKTNNINVYYLPEMISNNACGIAMLPTIKKKKALWDKLVLSDTEGYIIMAHNRMSSCNSTRGHTLAHEFGHLFNLRHETNNSNLMSGSGILGSELNSNQLRVVKEYYKYNLK
jgi:hypothetical protein